MLRSTTVVHAERCLLGRHAAELRIGPASVRIERGRIVEVHEGRPSSESVESGPQLEVRRLGSDRLLAPAFVDAHTHLALVSLRGALGGSDLEGNLVESVFFRVESQLRPEDVRAFTRVGALECLLHGTACVFDHYYFADAVAEAMREVGLSGVVAPTLQDLAGPGVDSHEESLEMTASLAADPRWAQAGLAFAYGPHATDTVSDGLWSQILDGAQVHGLPVHVHCAQSPEEFQRAVTNGARSPMDRLARTGALDAPVDFLLVHGLYLDREDLERLDPQRHRLGACPYSQLQFGFPAPVDDWTRRGLDWWVGTDCAASNDVMNVQKELRLLSGQSAFGVTYGAPREALARGAVAEVAEVVEEDRRRRLRRSPELRDPRFLFERVCGGPGGWHRQLRCGAIEVGAWAHLAIYDLAHPSFWPAGASDGKEGETLALLRALTLGDPSPARRTLVVGGRWLDDPGVLFDRPETRAWIEEADARRAELLTRAGVI